MHLLQGYHELKRVNWDAKALTLSGEVERMPGIAGKLFIYIPPGYIPHFDFPLTESSAQLTRITERVWAHEFQFGQRRYTWTIPFDRQTSKP